MKTTHVVLLVSAALLSPFALAQVPARNVNPNRHPNLAHAQQAIDSAFQAIGAAQQANEFDMDGHAAKAKDFLEQADREIKMAAMAANHP